MVRERPAILVVMGILNIVVGSLGLLCGICGVAANLGIAALGQANLKGPQGEVNPVKDLLAFMEREIPGYQIIEIGRGVLVLILGVVLLVGGIGLLMSANWGRWMSVVYGVFSIFLSCGYLVFELALVKPAVEKWQKAFIQKHGQLGAQQQNPGEACGDINLIGFNALFIIYSIALIIIMFLPVVSAACSGVVRKRRAFDEDEEDYDDRHDRGRRGRRDDDDDDYDRRVRRRRDDEDY